MKQRRALILAYDFPPYVSVGGLRPYSWYKYFKEFNIYPVVITRQWNNRHGNSLDYITASDSPNTQIEETEYGTIIKARYKPNLSNKILLKYGESRFIVFRKVITAFFEFSQFLFLIGPKSSLYFAAKKYLKTNKVDIIIATGVPFILFKYADKLSKRYDIPWMADYRDPWSFNKNKKGNFVIQKWNNFFEKKYLESAHSIVAVSVFLIKNIKSFISNKSFYIIPNGYDPYAIDSARNIVQGCETFSIAFVGTIYKWHPVESFLKGCDSFLDNNKCTKFQLDFYGINDENRIRRAMKTICPNLIGHVNIYSKLPNDQLLQKVSSDNVLLLFNHYSYMGTKIYDYVALKRKILLCYSDDVEANILKKKYYRIDESGSDSLHLQADLLNETNSGIVVRDTAHLKLVLQDLYAEFKLKGFVECNSVNTEKFSRKIQVQKLAEVVHQISVQIEK